MTESKPKSNLALRLSTAGVTAPFIIYMLYWGPAWLFPSVTGLVSMLGAWELLGMTNPEHRHQRLYGTAASLGLFSLLALSDEPRWFLLASVAVTCGGMLISLARPQPLETAALRMGWTLATPFYVGVLFAALVKLFQQPQYGGSWVLLALMCGFLSDTAGYFVGRAYGRRPLNAVVSPKKTVEGSIGGLGGGLAGGLLSHFWLLPALPLLDAVVLSLVATAAGQAGDLCESLVKRSTGVKDSGTILPGHGGVLDRSDAMLFAGATVWVYVECFVV